MAWRAKKADWGAEDMEAAAQEDHLMTRATEGPAVALLHSDVERREFISAGAAAGLAVGPHLSSVSQLQSLQTVSRHGTDCELHASLLMLVLTQPLYMHIHHMARHRVQAAFGAPIGGVLFSLEEASTYWSRKVAWRCFICTATAVFTLAQLHPRCSALPQRSPA